MNFNFLFADSSFFQFFRTQARNSTVLHILLNFFKEIDNFFTADVLIISWFFSEKLTNKFFPFSLVGPDYLPKLSPTENLDIV